MIRFRLYASVLAIAAWVSLVCAPEGMAEEVISPRMSASVNQIDGSTSGGADAGAGVNFSKDWTMPLIPEGPSNIFWSPGFVFRTASDSNVFRDRSGAKDDLILTYGPSIRLGNRGSRLKASAGYTALYDQYLRHPEHSGFDHQVDTAISAAGNKMTVEVYDFFSDRKLFPTSEQSERHPVLDNNLSAEVSVKLGPKIGGALNGSVKTFAYQDSATKKFSYWSYDVGPRLYYHFSKKLDFYAQYSYSEYDYYESGLYDSANHSYFLGVRGQPTSKVSTQAEGGFKSRTYSRSDLSGSDIFWAEGIVRWRLNRKNLLEISAKRDVQESVYRDVGYYVTSLFKISYEFKILDGLALIADTGTQFNEYPDARTELLPDSTGASTKRRSDYIQSAGAGISWAVNKNIRAETKYTYSLRNSNLDTLDYADHQVTLGLSIGL